jgi:hypothetical protein
MKLITVELLKPNEELEPDSPCGTGVPPVQAQAKVYNYSYIIFNYN